MAGLPAERSIKWQLCYDVTARTWWMVSGLLFITACSAHLCLKRVDSERRWRRRRRLRCQLSAAQPACFVSLRLPTEERDNVGI